MATTDVFNNPSNDYVNPGLAPCAGASDDAYFRFIDGGAGIISGADILAFLNLDSVNVPVSTWSIEKKTLQSGEVTYVPGPEKGLMNRTQIFDIPSQGYETPEAGEGAPDFFMQLDISIRYYHNFRYIYENIDASSNYLTNLNIDSAMNIALSNNNILVEMTYDPSDLTFVGSQVGYEYEISNAVLTVFDASTIAGSPFATPAPDPMTLIEDVSAALPAMKYPNGAMLGYVLKTKYPTDECMYDSWVYMNHVESPYEVYIPEIITNYISSTSQTITFDPSVQWGPFVSDFDVSIGDITCVSTGYSYDPSYGLPTYNADVDNSTLINESYSFSKISNSIIEYSGISDFRPINPDGSTWYIKDSSIFGSELWDNNVGAISPESFAESCFISDSSLTQVDVSGGFIQKSFIRLSLLENVEAVCIDLFEDSSILNSNVYNLLIDSSSSVHSSAVKNSIFTNAFIHDSSLTDVSINSSWIYSSYLEDSTVIDSSVINTNTKNVILENSITEGSSLLQTFINVNSNPINSIIENSWTNAFEVIPGLWANDVSCTREYIEGGVIHDSSINNTTVTNAEIYTSQIYDSSLIGCTLYNMILDESIDVIDCSIITVDASCITEITYDTSTYFRQYNKCVNVGMNGCGDVTTLSGPDYLDYINSHDLWFKVGPFASRISAPDAPGNPIKNAIGGFYIFNPQTFPVQVEYMVIN